MTRLTDRDAASAFAKQVAAHRGWKVNSDASFIDPVLDGLAAQSQTWGKPFCPCRDTDGTETDSDIVCPCRYAAADIAACGQCYCGLFLSPGKDPRTISSIPERRTQPS